MAMLDKNFTPFVNLLNRVKDKYPQIYGEATELSGGWGMNGCLDIQVTFSQEAPVEKLRNVDPGKYTIHISYDPYLGGSWGPAGWLVTDYGSFKGSLPCDPENDAYLKPHQTPYTRGFGEHWRETLIKKHGDSFKEILVTGYPNPRSWDGKRLFAGADYRILIAD